MSVLDLQQAIIDELKDLFSGQTFMKYRSSTDEKAEYIPLNFYKQALPYTQGDDASHYTPYIAVQIQKGSIDDEAEPEDAVILLNVCIFDDDPTNQVHASVLNIIETIRQQLFLKRMVVGKYCFKLPFKWQVNDEDIWPYGVGSIETHWSLPLTLPDNPNL